MRATIQHKTHLGGLPAIEKRMAGLRDVVVGILKGTGEHNNGTSGQSVAEVGYWNEFGAEIPIKKRKEVLGKTVYLDTGRKSIIPPRPFLRPTIKERRAELLRIYESKLADVLIGRLKVDNLLGLVGLKAVSLVQQKITDLRTPPNSPRTIAEKGSDNPLIDTGQLRQSINFAIRKR